MERSEISKQTWRRRKREGGKATCTYCGRPIFAGGVKSPGGKAYHKTCYEAYYAGLVPAQVGKNPKEQRAPRDAFRFGAEKLNPKYAFGPTGFRPPAKWFAKIAQGSAASYFGKQLRDLTRAEAAKVGQIVGGIWAKYTDKTRLDILRKYEPSAVRAVRNLPCPICGTSNPVSQSNVRLRCSKCGTSLRSVRVVRRKK